MAHEGHDHHHHGEHGEHGHGDHPHGGHSHDAHGGHSHGGHAHGAHDHSHGGPGGHDHGHPGTGSDVASEHRAQAPAQVASFVITCSDSRSAKTDEGGALAASLLEGAGHPIVGRKLVKDEPAEIRAAIDEAKANGARAIVLTGGTGIGRRDGTIEVVRSLIQKELPGFGELFRMLSFEQVGSAAMLSRAMAGAADGVILFALPGSPKAVRLALERLILPELGHAVRELMR